MSALVPVATALLLIVCITGAYGGSVTTATCNGRSRNWLTGTTGVLIVNSYGPNADCVWTITAPRGKVPLVQLVKMDVKKNPAGRCGDSLRFYDRWGRATYFLCGTTQLVPAQYKFTSGEQQFSVRLKSDSRDQGKGFNLAWTSVDRDAVLCGGDQDIKVGAEYAEISSNPGTFTYANNAKCTWKLEAPANKKVRLEFGTLNLAAPDAVEVREGSRNGTLLAKYTGRLRSSPPITSRGRFMTVSFSSNYIGAIQGFKARYKAV